MFSSGEWFQETGGPFDDTKQPAVMHIRAGSMIVLQKPAETTFLRFVERLYIHKITNRP